MSITVIVDSKIKPEKVEEILPFLKVNLPNVRGFEGCLNVTVLREQTSQRMIFHETWLSEAAHQQYIEFIRNNGVMNQLTSFLEEPPEIRYLEVLEI